MDCRRRKCPRWVPLVNSSGTHNWPTSCPSRISHWLIANTWNHTIAAPTRTLCRHATRSPWTLVGSSIRGIILDNLLTIPLFLGFVKDAPGGSKCAGCNDHLSPGEMSVIAPKARDNLWHPRCFVCSTCVELLVDLTYCIFDDKIFCERHYAEMLKPRCNSCDEVSADLTSSN